MYFNLDFFVTFLWQSVFFIFIQMLSLELIKYILRQWIWKKTSLLLYFPVLPAKKQNKPTFFKVAHFVIIATVKAIWHELLYQYGSYDKMLLMMLVELFLLLLPLQSSERKVTNDTPLFRNWFIFYCASALSRHLKSFDGWSWSQGGTYAGITHIYPFMALSLKSLQVSVEWKGRNTNMHIDCRHILFFRLNISGCILPAALAYFFLKSLWLC